MNKEIKITEKLRDKFVDPDFVIGDPLTYVTVGNMLQVRFDFFIIELDIFERTIVTYTRDIDSGYIKDIACELRYDFENSYERVLKILTKKIMEAYE